MNSVLTNDDISVYLTLSRQDVVDKLSNVLAGVEDVKPLLKQALYKYLKEDVGCVDAKLMYAPMCKLLEDFSFKAFTNRVWVYKPHFMQEVDYNTLKHLAKVPIRVKNFNNSNEIYTFPNNLNVASSAKFEKIKVEPQFYTNEDNNIMFGKLMRLKYVPIDQQKVEKLNQEMTDYDCDDSTLFDKVMSISFCALIQGDSQNAVPLYRYDSSKLQHTNFYIGSDERKEIFGEVVQSPHFHFQTENDSLLCLRKYHKRNNKEHLYKSGRCNAIDCAHLRNYLIDLEMMSNHAIEKRNSHNQNYGMPFLKMRYEQRIAQCEFVKKVSRFLKSMNPDERKQLVEVEKWLSKSMGERFDIEKNEYVSYDYYPIFGELIKAIDFIEFVYNLRANTTSIATSKVLAEIELLTANEVIDTMAEVRSEKELKKQGLDLNERVLIERDDCCQV